MQQRVTIVPLYAEGVRHVIEHMRATDRAEVWAVSAEGADAPAALAPQAFEASRWGAVAAVDGRPAVAMGAIECWPGTAAMWLLATDDWRHCWRNVLRWVREHLPATMRGCGVGCAFVYAIEGRPEVHRFLRACGFVRRGVVPAFGRDRQSFALWSVTGGRA